MTLKDLYTEGFVDMKQRHNFVMAFSKYYILNLTPLLESITSLQLRK